MIFKKSNSKNQNETREDRFKRVASRRVGDLLHKMKLLRNCADKANYSYTDEQVNKIFKAINDVWKEVQMEFNKHKTKRKEFRL